MISSMQNIQKRKPKSIASFILKTYDLLNDQHNSNIVKWSVNGIGFVVVDELQFAKTLLPKYFKHSNYSSFVRQLNMYNFHKIREHNGESYFHHEHFDRDNKQDFLVISRSALTSIRRKPEKKKRKLIDDEEDFSDDKEFASLIRENDKENHFKPKAQKRVGFADELSSKLLTFQNDAQSQESKSIIMESKDKLTTTKQLFSSQFTIKFENPPFDSSSQKKIDQNLWESEYQNDDKISINDDIEERIPPFPTKQFMYPSKHNLFPFSNKGGENFDMFF